MDGWIGLSGCGKWMDVESGCGKWKVASGAVPDLTICMSDSRPWLFVRLGMV